MEKIDCVINVCQKPFQTALTLYSLLKHSAQHIDKIYFIEENVQRAGYVPVDHSLVLSELKERIVYFQPKHFLYRSTANKDLLKDRDYRYSIRYQYGWEKSDKKFIFLTHNDCYYKGDVIGLLLESIGNNIAAGEIGQCWNCPARQLNKCEPDNYQDYKPSLAELKQIYAARGIKKRPYHKPRFGHEFRINSWPLPECRLNEWAALINLKKARKITAPFGRAFPFGAYRLAGENILDIGVGWFRDISQMGFSCKNVDFRDNFQHFKGHKALDKEDIYTLKEENALKFLSKEFNIIVHSALHS
ncbi:hypothetical protein [Desulfonatronovibrio magnus]|uniref:hypothetical protein n=1 Tax=Desulfonatronovibrio magnus TaxID=698827 RepID=UPI0005EACEE7|nr:hypothetical protein [Desulfonatronovibrio magnus]